MKIVIGTQYMENYGAHDWDEEGECPQRWKYKGGSTYVVRNLSPEQVMNVNDIPTLVDLIEYSNNYEEEYVIDWSIEDNDVKECEEWETPWDLSYTSREGWVASRYTPRESYWEDGVEGKMESYVMGKGGERVDYTCDYIRTANAA